LRYASISARHGSGSDGLDMSEPMLLAWSWWVVVCG